MKKVLAKDLKVGDVVYDTPVYRRKFSVKKIDDETIYLFWLNNVYFKEKDGFVTFPIDDNRPWYMED